MMTMQQVDAKPLKAMNPDRLRKLMDSSNEPRNVPVATLKRQHQITSWNGEQCDTRAFEKLTAPAHVILAKDRRSGKSFAVVPSGLQMDDVYIRPKNEQLRDRLTAPLMTKKEAFGQAPEIEHRVVPASVMLNEGLMTPHQRRERQQFETDHLCALRAMQRRERNDRRLHQIINEHHTTSDVFGGQQTSDTIRVRGDAYKPDLLSHTCNSVAGASSHREYQSKNGNANPRLQHFDRLFKQTPFVRNQQRAQRIRNESTAGRQYNIINGGEIEYFPPTIPEKQHAWQTHPSVIIHPYTR